MEYSLFHYSWFVAITVISFGLHYFYKTFFVSEEAILRAYQKSLEKGLIKEKYRHTSRYYLFIFLAWIGVFSFSFFLFENLFYEIGTYSFLIIPLSVFNTGKLFIDNHCYKKMLQQSLQANQ